MDSTSDGRDAAWWENVLAGAVSAGFSNNLRALAAGKIDWIRTPDELNTAGGIDTDSKAYGWTERGLGGGAWTIATGGVGWNSLKTVLGKRAAENEVDDFARLTASQQRSIRSLQSQVETHQAKLEAYRGNPDVHDNLGILERAPTPEIRQRIIDGRIRHLETEIRTFQNQIDKLLGSGQ